MQKNFNKLLDTFGLAVFNDFLIPAILVNPDGVLIKFNSEFEKIFEFKKDAKSPPSLDRIINTSGAKLKRYLKKPVKSGYAIKFSNRKGQEKFMNMFSKKITFQAKIFYLVIFFDLTNVRETMQYFQQSFDQFMGTTIKLEKALATIEKQKSEIEIINHELREKGDIMKKDMDIAIILQNELLPSLPDSQHWDMSLCYKPMLGVSGDTYDFHLFHDMDFIGVVLLDASGHGIASSLITNIARPAFFRSHMRYRKDKLEKAMEASNRELLRQIGEAPNYLTGLSLRVYPDSITYVNAGHPYILFYQAQKGTVSELKNDGILLGLKGFPQDFHSYTKKAAPGDIILIYTDGLTEAANRQNKEFGVRKIKEILKGNKKDAEGIKKDILEKLSAYGINIDKLQDDMTFIIMKKK